MAQQDDTRGFVPGPLDDLVPGLRQKRDRLPALPVHPRVLEAQRDGNTHALVLSSFAAPAGARAFHVALKPLVEAALLSELARPVEELREGRSSLAALELFLFAQPGFEVTPALAPFALVEAPLRDADARRTLPLLRSEAQFVDGLSSDEPCARYAVAATPCQEALCRELAHALLEGAKGPFGAEPGGLARRACEFLARRGVAGVTPTRAGIERLEQLIVPTAPSVLRWIEPLLFQALCDLVAVAAHTTWGLEVEWGVSEVDPETGVAPPPLIRIHRDGDPVHIPLGEHVLRWCVMPMRAGEEIPSLGAWAEHEFA